MLKFEYFGEYPRQLWEIAIRAMVYVNGAAFIVVVIIVQNT